MNTTESMESTDSGVLHPLRVSFVAEVSSNHARDLQRALRFIEAAAEIGCAAVKFQQFRIDALFAREALQNDERLRRRRAWELPESFNADLSSRARELGLQYANTPFYLDAVGMLEPHVDFYKVSSYQVLWHDLLVEVARTGKPVVLSTGMADMGEIKRAVDALWDGGCRQLTLLHCVSGYPTPPTQANLAAIATMRDAFGCNVGWSDHTVDPGVVLRAVNRWRASMVEFHLDLDSQGAEFGAGHCWLPAAARAVVAKCRTPRRACEFSPLDGDGRVTPQPCEINERAWRTDPVDGLRPLREERQRLAGA